MKSGKTIEKIFVRRGDREGSITVLVAEAINRKIPVIETEKEKLVLMITHDISEAEKCSEEIFDFDKLMKKQ